MDSLNEPIANETSEDYDISKTRCRGRGFLIKKMNQRLSNGKSENLSSSSILSSQDMKSNAVVHNQDLVNKSCFQDQEYEYEKPARSIYIPPEPNENDESIYEDGISSGINFEKFNDIEVKVNGENVPKPIESFETLNNVPEKLMENIRKCNFLKPTPIQKYSIPIILSGKDLMATAQTGSGKTVAYVLPIIQKLLMNPQILVKDSVHSEPQVVIMAPTRELAVQIKMVVLKLTRGTGISLFVCYGGTLVSHQKDKILKGCHILVATPGRLNEFVQHGFITFSSLRFFVLDEVDRMLDIDSKPDIDKVLDHFSMPSVMNRQTIMLSATLPDVTQHLAKYYLNKNYLFLAVGIISSASKDIKQNFYMVNRFNKREILCNILRKDSVGTIVFVKQKWTADFLATYLCEKHIPSTSIHGDRLQDQRENALNDFRNGKMNVLVATTVASRGLDIKCVNHVINYDMPQEIEEYVQRIGRTGRLGNQGIATSLFDPDEDHLLIDPIINTLASANQEIPNWLLKLGRESKFNDANVDFDKFGGSDIRILSGSVDECEEW
ncbi:PREDICTED: ATP-dependent RNA helicase vasa, isoform A-like [Diuraphis noxia]|uniref:ATP-dependent RNA helicase vasa, isoform A-like n=1 Tax=Diuraphis noxia TaxID=143948 RepID=UPI000763A53B|nr:PREDICTED: ATP-dependent RNA helicase vasa, isoform A-like [Diuraphis noxia]